MKSTSIIAAVALASTLAAVAPASADWIDNRQANQMQRIEQGLRSGQLTRSEYNRLVEQQREIARLERILERDGRLTPAERLRLSALQNEASRNIFVEKHDSQNQYTRGADRGWGYGWRGGNSGYGYGRGDNGRGVEYGARRWYHWY